MNRALTHNIATGTITTAGGVSINAPLKDLSVDGLNFFFNTSTTGAITDAFLRASKLSITLNVSKGENAIISNNIPLIHFAKISDYEGGFGDFSGDTIAFKVDLGNIIVSGDDILNVNIEFGTPAASINYTIFTNDTVAGAEKIYQYQLTTLAQGSPNNFPNAVKAFLLFSANNPSVSDSNKISVSDYTGSYMVSEIESLTLASVQGLAEQWQDLGLLFIDKTGFTQNITISGAGNNEVAVIRKWYLNPYRTENFQKSYLSNEAYAKDIAQTQPEKAKILLSYYKNAR